MPNKSFFKFSAQQRAGIFLLVIIIVGIQILYYFRNENSQEESTIEKQAWLSMQAQIDTATTEKTNYKAVIYPFNPNFITDFKGYKLGMSTKEINRLLEFRKKNRYVNSAEEFQELTKVSDSLLKTMAPYFKFPDWVTNKKQSKGANSFANNKYSQKEKVTIQDINLASQDDLIKVYGIGQGLSERILKQKEILGGFVSMDQMLDIWGLSPEVIEKLNQQFKIGAIPNVKKFKINDLSAKELQVFPYFRYPLNKEIVTYRSMNGGIKNADDLLKIKGFPADKVKIIERYIEF